jgi:HAD domain in Swiss Army Knife RNA repair proteins
VTETDIALTMDSDAPTVYLGFTNVLHRGEAFLGMLGRVILEPEGKPFGDTHHLLDALTPYPNVQVVLTSSWTWWVGDTEVIALLPRAIATKVVGTTCEFPPLLEEAVTCRGFVGSIIRHAIAHRVTSWLAIGSDFRGVPPSFASHFFGVTDDRARG